MLGCVIGLFFSCGVGGLGVYLYNQRVSHRVRAGWNLVPVIVASQDLPEGTVLSFDVVSQRPIPEQFVTSSIVKPDSASYVIGGKLLVPVQSGDPLTWSMFAEGLSHEACERRCAWVKESEASSESVERRRALRERAPVPGKKLQSFPNQE